MIFVKQWGAAFRSGRESCRMTLMDGSTNNTTVPQSWVWPMNMCTANSKWPKSESVAESESLCCHYIPVCTTKFTSAASEYTKILKTSVCRIESWKKKGEFTSSRTTLQLMSPQRWWPLSNNVGLNSSNIHQIHLIGHPQAITSWQRWRSIRWQWCWDHHCFLWAQPSSQQADYCSVLINNKQTSVTSIKQT